MNYDGSITIKTELDNKDFRAQIKKLEDDLDTLVQEQSVIASAKPYDKQQEDLLDYADKISKVNNRLVELNKKQSEIDRLDLTNVENSIKKVGTATTGVINKIGKWALAIFGVRTAYNAIRGAINVISQQDKQLLADIEYMKNALAYTLEPIVRAIVDLAKKLMFYVGYIAKAWTGKNIFENANKSLAGANKQAKNLSKTLAGFDEMNVLSDSSSSEAVATPSFDLSSPEDVEVPSWLKWIAENKDIVLSVLAGIAGALVAIKMGADILTGLGIGIILAGVVVLIQGIIDFIKDPSWQNFLTILQGIALIVAGIAVLMGGWIVALVALGVALVASIIKNWDKVKEILGKVGNWIYEKIIKPVGDFFAGLWNGIKKGFKSAFDWIKEKFKAIVDFFSGIISKVVGLFKKIGTKVGDAIGSAFKSVINGVLKAIENILNFPIKSINKLIKVINEVPGINIEKLPTFDLPRLAVGGVVNMPGKGINYGGANIGERGAEGVIPLTNSQMMSQLGEAIGKFVNINATVPVYVGNRQIAREIKKINAESDFAFNR